MNTASPFRRASQIFGFLLINLYAAVVFEKHIYRGPFKSICLPFLYCHSCPTAGFACPLGLMQNYAAIHQFPFFLVGHLMLVGILVGRMVCGWLCPVGLLQELMHKIQSIKPPSPARFSVLPYLVFLILIVILPYVTTEHWFSKLCPIGTLVAGVPWVFWNPVNPDTGSTTIEAGAVGFLFAVKLLILAGALWLFTRLKRPFCRHICPMGLFWSFFNKISLIKLNVDGECTKCDACERSCPQGLKVYEDPNSGNCIRCLECTSCKHVKVVRSLQVKAAEPGKTMPGTR